MSIDRDVTPVVRSWLEKRGEGLVDPNRGFDRLLELVGATPQVGRRPWAPGPPAAIAHTRRRSASVFSATRLIAAIAIVALGTGTLFFAASTGPSPTPTPSPSPVVTAIDAGSGHTCAIVEERAWCWGGNGQGQLGDGTAGGTRRFPVPVRDLVGVSAISAGQQHSCAIVDGRAWCWGRWEGPFWDASGRQGEPDDVLAVPRQVPGLEAVTAIAAGDNHTCAVAQGRAWCWGNNRVYGSSFIDGMLGVDDIEHSAIPLQVEGLEGVTAIAAGWGHSCAVVDGQAWCWGRRTATPTLVPGLEGITQISAAGDTTCALAQGRAWCWGRNDEGQLGDGTRANTDTVDPAPRPVTRAGPGVVTRVETGGDGGCGLVDGELHCWQLLSPPASLANVTTFSVGGSHACAIASGTVRCWGEDWDGQLGGRGEGAPRGQLGPEAFADPADSSGT